MKNSDTLFKSLNQHFNGPFTVRWLCWQCEIWNCDENFKPIWVWIPYLKYDEFAIKIKLFWNENICKLLPKANACIRQPSPIEAIVNFPNVCLLTSRFKI